jgi:hypothetical protein
MQLSRQTSDVERLQPRQPQCHSRNEVRRECVGRTLSHVWCAEPW